MKIAIIKLSIFPKKCVCNWCLIWFFGKKQKRKKRKHFSSKMEIFAKQKEKSNFFEDFPTQHKIDYTPVILITAILELSLISSFSNFFQLSIFCRWIRSNSFPGQTFNVIFRKIVQINFFQIVKFKALITKFSQKWAEYFYLRSHNSQARSRLKQWQILRILRNLSKEFAVFALNYIQCVLSL